MKVQVVVQVGNEDEFVAVLLGAKHEGFFGFGSIAVAAVWSSILFRSSLVAGCCMACEVSVWPRM